MFSGGIEIEHWAKMTNVLFEDHRGFIHVQLKPFQLSVAFHIGTSNLFFKVK